MVQSKVKNKTKYGKEGIVGVLFAMTPVLGFLIFGVAPLIFAVAMSFMHIRGFNISNATFAGVDNYTRLIGHDNFWHSIRVTLVAALAMPVSLIISLIIANFMHHNKFGTKAFRTIFFIPFVCSAVAVAIMWRWVFDFNFGILNTFRNSLGLDPIPWLTSGEYIWISMIIMGVWSGTAFGIILYSAALNNVPKAYYEAAKIDGAGSIRRFFNITLPGISPTTFFLLTVGLIGSLQDFTRFFVMLGRGAGAEREGLTVVFWLFQMGYDNMHTYGMGMAAAWSIIVGAGIIIITRINFWLSKKWVHYE